MLVLLFVIVIILPKAQMDQNLSDYLEKRKQFLQMEKKLFIGGDLLLSDKEQEVDEIMKREKLRELAESYQNNMKFLPAQHFFQSKEKIDKSKVFDVIKKMPKGGSLHTHLLAAVSIDYILANITGRWERHIYCCFVKENFKMRVLQSAAQDKSCNWKPLHKYKREINQEHGNGAFDEFLKKQLSLYGDGVQEVYTNNANLVWHKFKRIFSTTYDLYSYKPIFEDYVYQLLKELYEDNVFYTELMGTFMQLYELNGTTYNNEIFIKTFIGIVDKFKRDYPKFVGVKYILSIYKGVDPQILDDFLKEVLRIQNLFPNFIAGFNFVGYEEEGNTLLYYAPQLLKAQKSGLKYFFHAGETNWFGHTDLNLLDAVLLNSVRIGHGFSFIKHPQLLTIAKDKQIAIELCPISNQVLALNNDPRNHPAVNLLAQNYPVVICNDDPAIWGAKGLSYDWYVTYLAMIPADLGLSVLKQFAINSITYSTLNESEKLKAMETWQKEWNQFIKTMSKS